MSLTFWDVMKWTSAKKRERIEAQRYEAALEAAQRTVHRLENLIVASESDGRQATTDAEGLKGDTFEEPEAGSRLVELAAAAVQAPVDAQVFNGPLIVRLHDYSADDADVDLDAGQVPLFGEDPDADTGSSLFKPGYRGQYPYSRPHPIGKVGKKMAFRPGIKDQPMVTFTAKGARYVVVSVDEEGSPIEEGRPPSSEGQSDWVRD